MSGLRVTTQIALDTEKCSWCEDEDGEMMVVTTKRIMMTKMMPMMEIMVMVDGGGDDDGHDTISITFIIFQVVYMHYFTRFLQ